MRKITVLLAVILLLNITNQANAQSKSLKSGFSLNLISGAPSAENYGLTGLDPDLKNKVFLGFEIGNRWYIKPQKKFGVGIMVNWFDISFQYSEVEPPKEYSNNRTNIFNIAVFEIGPISTVALTEKIGLDAYYNVRPTYMKHSIYLDENWETGEGYDADDEAAMGFSHTCGLSVRWKALALSAEYLFGSIKTIDGLKLGDGGLDVNFQSEKLHTNHFRIMLGFKF